MPKQGLQMTEGTITKWLVSEGEQCKEGEPLFEMETDKLTITMDANATGKLLKIVHGAGDTVEITKTIAIIGEDGEDISDLINEDAVMPSAEKSVLLEEKTVIKQQDKDIARRVRAEGERVFSTPRARMRAQEKNISINDVMGSGPDGLVIEKDVLSFVPLKSTAATPLAKKIARLEGVNIDEISGTGYHGKVVSGDVLAAISEKTLSRANNRGIRTVPMTAMRRAIAKNMCESLKTNAQLIHQVHVDMTKSDELRTEYKNKNIKISYNDIVLLACTKALLQFPIMNASIDGNNIIMHDYVNIGVAVAIDGGLIVPNVKNADLMSLEDISICAKELATRAKEGKLAMDDYKGGTFTVSNLGMFGIDNFTAIINPPEAGILAVGKVEKRPVVRNDEIIIRPMMTITLSYDHRIVDGAPAAQFIALVKEYIENPVMML